jgi:hypothetical protein
MIKLGSKVKDVLTGFTGRATARVEYEYGCARIFIEPGEMKDGKPIEGIYFDEQRVEVVEEKLPVISKDNSATTGGLHDNPTRTKDPIR